MAQKFANWFVSHTGRKTISYIAGATSIGIISAWYIPNTFLLNKYEDVVSLYKFGVKVKVTEPIMNRFHRALNLLEVPLHDRNIIKPFMVFGFDMFNAGSLYSKYGGIIGVPANFSCIDIPTIEKDDIMVLNEPVNWSTIEGQELLESLILSESAQIFAIAREILYLKSLKVLFHTLFGASSFIVTYGVARSMNTKYNLLVKPFSLRCLMYSIVGLFGFGIYSCLTDFTQINYDKYVDKTLCEINPLFIEGGREFYDKTLQRNRALRKLMGPLGEKYYSVIGNERFFVRQKCLPIITRRDFYDNKMRQMIV